jgi:pimeloyl-ACP methyl ester carboxylesterase
MRVALVVICAALFVAAAFVYAIHARDLASAHARVTGRSTTVKTSSGIIEYAVIGEGEPMLVIHGASGGFDQALDMAGALTGFGYQLMSPSRFGYLRSDMPANPTPALQADAYVELLDRLDIDKVAVAGISAGAWSALQFAIRHPERCRALVLLVPANFLPEGVSIHGGAVVRAIFSSDFIAWAALKAMPLMPGAMTRMMLGTEPAVLQAADASEKTRVQQVLDHLLPMSPRTRGIEFDVKTAATREHYPIEKISCPVLTISAEDDRFGTASRARSIAASVQDGRSVVFKTGGHALIGEYENALRESVAFLKAAREREGAASDALPND